eukprot:TRINITY_DN50653_c0_g1_i1.p1 TRINITY_DN50653_c0_g1~~TRINITY_DN50653_c0_g1_i1.p1  ORF type:complete len:230 (+),score=41.51 TRINITY_DN50653_c0_g1_i1:23-691(+)
MVPPKMRFATKLFHPNVGCGHTPGAICLDILRKEGWSPALTLERTFLSIASLLADPNPASPMDAEAARLFEHDRPTYDRRVREAVRKYASASGAQAVAYSGDFGSADGDERTPAVGSSSGAAVASATSTATAAAPASGAIAGTGTGTGTGTGSGASKATAESGSGGSAPREPSPPPSPPAPAVRGPDPSWYEPVVIDLDDLSDGEDAGAAATTPAASKRPRR